VRRGEFVDWLEAQLQKRGVPVRRWTVQPGLDDLEIRLEEQTVRLRIVRTAPPGGESGQPSGA
jgi:hypothetical protein